MSKNGLNVIQDNLKTMPEKPGVYRMIGEDGKVLYVGKAINLKNRVSSYTQIEKLPSRLQKMVLNTCYMEVITTGNEAEALILESDLIKNLKPKYNILLTDDKSFPYITISDDEFPRIYKYRGQKDKKLKYFGPFPSVGAVNETLKLLQELFLLRSCTNSYFKNRSRPCILYDIKRCSGPCVGKISTEEYNLYVKQAKDFFEGKSISIIQRLVKKMNQLSENKEYEMAAYFRDKIEALKTVQMQSKYANIKEDIDVIGLSISHRQACVQVHVYKNGFSLGNKSYFFKGIEPGMEQEILSSFIVQYYSKHEIPKEIILGHFLDDKELLEDFLSNKNEKRVYILNSKAGDKKQLLDKANQNASVSLERKMNESASQIQVLKELQKLLGLKKVPERIDVFDNSHIQSKHAVGAMIVAGKEGFMKNQYRKFKIKELMHAGDDFAMMEEVLKRRYKRAAEDHSIPDIVLIDGGKGQLSAAKKIFLELGLNNLSNPPYLAAIAKGIKRNAGEETIYTADGKVIKLPKTSPILYFLQRIRDEAHRFVITFHRAKRAKSITQSPLDTIEGIGRIKKKALLSHFGSIKNIQEASITDICKVNGVNKELAIKIKKILH
jgi:excinuclease ABC subunit C